MMLCATIEQAQWAARTALLPHQQEAVAKLLPSRVGALFMDMGTGKTRTAIELARIRQHKIDRVIWFCPVSLKPTIHYEILKHTDCTPEQVCVFDDKITVRTIPNALWYIVGIESISSSARVILTTNALITEHSFVIVDESTTIKGHRAKRTERITLMPQRCRYRLVLTGTPFTQGAVDLYSQMRFLSPRILGYASWYSFARNHVEWSDKYRGKIERCLNTDWLAAKIRPYVYQVTKSECLTLPQKLYEARSCNLTNDQLQAYDEAKQQFVEDVMTYDEGGGLQSSIPIFRLFSALQGIVCGFHRFMGSEPIQLTHKRLELLLDTLTDIPAERVVIWCKYRYCTAEIVQALTAQYGIDAVNQFHGSLTPARREAELQQWRKNGRFLVARQSVGAHGLDLTAARYAVYYANAFKYSERIQSEDRCHRIGQHRNVTYIDLWANCKIEDRIATALATKGNALRNFRDEVDKIKANRKERIRRLVEAL